MSDYKSITTVGGNDFDTISGSDGSCFIMLVTRVVEAEILRASGKAATTVRPSSLLPLNLRRRHTFDNMKTSQILLCLDLIIVSCAAMTENCVKDWFNNQIELQKQSAMRFTGRHNVLMTDSNATKDIIDFDFHAEMSEFADLDMIQIKRSNVVEEDLVTTVKDAKTDDRDLVQQAIEKLESIAALGYDRFAV